VNEITTTSLKLCGADGLFYTFGDIGKVLNRAIQQYHYP
jgi:hypothetical protein